MKIQLKMPDELQGTGFPTFEEYCKNPKRWRKPKDEVFGAVDEGGHTLRHLMLPGMTFEIMGYKCDTLEEVERIANSQGYQIDHLEAKPRLIPDVGGSGSQQKARVHVVFEPKPLYLLS